MVDANRPVKRHGIPPARLACELEQVGLAQKSLSMLPGTDSYVATFTAARPRPPIATLAGCTRVTAF